MFADRSANRLLRTTQDDAQHLATEAGQRLLDRIRPAASELETALQDAKMASERPSGVVRIKSPKLAFQTYVESRIGGFNAKHPDIVLDVTIDDAVVDLVAGKDGIGIIR